MHGYCICQINDLHIYSISYTSYVMRCVNLAYGTCLSSYNIQRGNEDSRMTMTNLFICICFSCGQGQEDDYTILIQDYSMTLIKCPLKKTAMPALSYGDLLLVFLIYDETKLCCYHEDLVTKLCCQLSCYKACWCFFQPKKKKNVLLLRTYELFKLQRRPKFSV